MPKPYYKKSHRCWYLNIQGKPVRLSPDKKQAWDLYHQAMAGSRDVGPDTSFLELVAEFLSWSKANNSPATYRWYQAHLESFHRHLGPMKIRNLKPFHVERWIAARYKTKNGSTLNGAMRAPQRVLNWAVSSGRLSINPLARMKKPTPTTREVDITPDQFQQLLDSITDQPFRDIVEIMRQTGCRPQEARSVEARHVQDGCWVFPPSEAKGNRERVILLNDRAAEITNRLVARYPEGKLFRNQRGNPWNRNSLDHRFRRLRQRLGFYVCPYLLRHAFATDAITKQVDLISLSHLMGHTDLRMLQKTYAKVQKRGEHLRAALNKATA